MLVIGIRKWTRCRSSLCCTLLFAELGCSSLLNLQPKFHIFFAKQFNAVTFGCRFSEHQQHMFCSFAGWKIFVCTVQYYSGVDACA